MLFTDDVLFVHAPKTGGMAVTKYLLANLPGIKTLTVPPGSDKPAKDVVIVEGRRHENLTTAAARLSEMSRDLASFKTIISTIRNPYAIEVSRYHYLRQGRAWDKGPLQALAMDGDFDRFCQEATYPYLRAPRPIETYYTIDGVMPPNLRLIRNEHMAEDLASLFGPPKTKLDHMNVSKHKHWSEYITPTNEPYLYDKYRWLFQYYPRMTEFKNTVPPR